MPSYYEIPVIIPSYEPDEKLITLLAALQEAGIRHVIVVDDGSGEQYASFFTRAAAFTNCEVLRHAVNLGSFFHRTIQIIFDRIHHLYHAIDSLDRQR